MAGKGSRFIEQGYNSIKAMIQIENESMFIKTTKVFQNRKNGFLFLEILLN